MSEKCKKNMDLNVVDCRGLCPRNDGGPSAERNSLSWMPDQVGHDNGVVSQSGRSMVEMLGTLAIVGVLSAGAIGGYSYAMNKHRTNELIYEATKRAQWVGTQLEMNKNAQNIGFGGFGTDTFGGGKFTGTVKTDLANPNQFGIAVSGLKEGVCKNIIKGLETETNGVIRAVKTTDGASDFNVDNCDDNAEFLLVFNRDLSANDSEIIPNEPEVSGEVSEQATETATPETVPSDRKVHCNDRGDWDGNTCDCDAGYDGETCSIEINAQPDEPEETATGTGGYEPEETATAQSGDAECNYRGTWDQWYNNGAGRCICSRGWGGSDCSQDMTDACGEHGSWIESTGGTGFCDCESGWGGSDCSISKSCSGRGRWYDYLNNDAGGCACNIGWGGSDCSEDHTNDCGEHGYWCGSGCTCDSGWGGSDCSIENACSGHGTWYYYLNNNAGGCECNSGWDGSDCSENHTCSGHGRWYGDLNNGAGRCICDSNWGGSDCSEDKSNACSGNGYWYQWMNNDAGGCDCNSGWFGSDCSEDKSNACSGHGTWYQWRNNGAGGCFCDSGYTGSDCSTPN